MPETKNGFEYEPVDELYGFRVIDMVKLKKIVAVEKETGDVWTIHPYGESEDDDMESAVHTVKSAVKAVYAEDKLGGD